MPAARVLWARGFRDAESVRRMRRPELSDLHDPFLMTGMEAAVRRLRAAIARGERVMLYGDYDVDGTLSVVLLRKTLSMLGLDAEYYVPDRFREGYGIQPEVLADAARRGVTLVISVDTGIRAAPAVEQARALGLDVIVTDHHLPESELPPALAVLNPNQPGCRYPNKHLCGAGVAFKLIQALLSEDRRQAWLDSLMMLVAIATVADVVPLKDENRVLVKRGLQTLPQTKNVGLKALLRVAGIEPQTEIRAWDVAFRIGPRLNAAGRITHARNAIELFFTGDPARASALAAELDAWNTERRAEGDRIFRLILDQGFDPAARGLVFAGDDWHRGVVGIVASRVVERYCRPSVVLSLDGETGLAQGSARSAGAFHLLEALERIQAASGILTKFGGHRQAAGLTLPRDQVPAFRRLFEREAASVLSEEDLAPVWTADAELPLNELTDAAALEVLALDPFGNEFPEPLFWVRDVRVVEKSVFAQKHLRVRCMDAQGRSVAAKFWNGAEQVAEVPDGPAEALVAIQGNPSGAARGYAPWDLKLIAIRQAD